MMAGPCVGDVAHIKAGGQIYPLTVVLGTAHFAAIREGRARIGRNGTARKCQPDGQTGRSSQHNSDEASHTSSMQVGGRIRYADRSKTRPLAATLVTGAP